MFLSICKKAALFGVSTVAGVALTGTIMANSAQAGTMTYKSEFSVNSNSLNGSDILTGDFNFRKTELDSGDFSYQLTGFKATMLNESFTLKDIRKNPDPFKVLNEALIPEKYKGILERVLKRETPHYTGDGDFGEGNLSYTFGFDLGNPNFQPDNFDFVFSSEDLGNVTKVASNLLEVDSSFTQFFVPFALSQGGQLNIITKEVPEPTTIFGIAVAGLGLTATRRKRTREKIKQKIAA